MDDNEDYDVVAEAIRILSAENLRAAFEDDMVDWVTTAARQIADHRGGPVTEDELSIIYDQIAELVVGASLWKMWLEGFVVVSDLGDSGEILWKKIDSL